MQYFFSNIPISFRYPAFDQSTGLFVRASIYDVSTGSPSFVTTVNMTNISNGYYFGNFTGTAGKTYHAIILCYTDGTYSTVETGRAPESQIYKEVTAPQNFLPFELAIYDFETSQNVAASIYDCTSGSASFVAKVTMSHVLGGVYFGSRNVTTSKVYQIEKLVYTDNTFTVVDTEYTPGSDDFTAYFPPVGPITLVTNLIEGATLTGANLAGQLTGANLVGILQEG